MELLEEELHAHVETQKLLITMQAQRIKELEEQLLMCQQIKTN